MAGIVLVQRMIFQWVIWVPEVGSLQGSFFVQIGVIAGIVGSDGGRCRDLFDSEG